MTNYNEKLDEQSNIDLRQGDCLELMKDIPDKSVDMILTDPPYGTTACKWDSVIPFEPMWKQLKRVIKPNERLCCSGASRLLRCWRQVMCACSNMSGFGTNVGRPAFRLQNTVQ